MKAKGRKNKSSATQESEDGIWRERDMGGTMEAVEDDDDGDWKKKTNMFNSLCKTQ